MKRWVVAGALMFGVVGCVPKGGRLESNRFQSSEYPYAVFYEKAGTADAPFGGAWRTDNFVDAAGTYRVKNGPEYMVKRRYDLNGDGKLDYSANEPFYDLLLEHAQKEAQLWVRTVPIEAKDANKDLSVFAERYVESVSGSGSVVVRFGAEGPLGQVGRRFASRTTDSHACELSKREAYRVDFEVANVDQLQLADNARWERGSVVFVRTGYTRRVHDQGFYRDYPVLMVIGMSARPQDFGALEPDFERLLQQTVLGDVGQGLSMNGSSTCAMTQAASSAGGEAPGVEGVAPNAPALDTPGSEPTPVTPGATPETAPNATAPTPPTPPKP